MPIAGSSGVPCCGGERRDFLVGDFEIAGREHRGVPEPFPPQSLPRTRAAGSSGGGFEIPAGERGAVFQLSRLFGVAPGIGPDAANGPTAAFPTSSSGRISGERFRDYDEGEYRDSATAGTQKRQAAEPSAAESNAFISLA